MVGAIEDKLLYSTVFATGAEVDPSRPDAVYCGLLLDEWVEVVPTEDATTGLAFHFDRPNSEAPQAILLATPPQHRGAWQWQDVVDTLHETLDFARLRVVEPAHLDRTALGGSAAGGAVLRHDAPDHSQAQLRFQQQRTRRPGRGRGGKPRETMNPYVVAENIDRILTRKMRIPTVVMWNRLEGRPRRADFSQALKAEVRDPLWMITRQWQMGEFIGEDAGSPVTVKAAWSTDAVTGLHTAAGVDLTIPISRWKPWSKRVRSS